MGLVGAQPVGGAVDAGDGGAVQQAVEHGGGDGGVAERAAQSAMPTLVVKMVLDLR